jgi:hypothetical protein
MPVINKKVRAGRIHLFPGSFRCASENLNRTYHFVENLLYERNDYAVAAISFLKEIGIGAEVLERIDQ